MFLFQVFDLFIFMIVLKILIKGFWLKIAAALKLVAISGHLLDNPEYAQKTKGLFLHHKQEEQFYTTEFRNLVGVDRQKHSLSL